MGVRGLLRVQRPAHIGGTVYLVLLAVCVVCVVVAALGAWRVGVSGMAAALILAAVARTRLPEDEAGMLGVRGKPFDVAVLLVVSATLLALAVGIPDQPGP